MEKGSVRITHEELPNIPSTLYAFKSLLKQKGVPLDGCIHITMKPAYVYSRRTDLESGDEIISWR